MRQVVLIALALAGIAGSAPVRANDSAAVSAAGGLVLRQERNIDMLSEDLFISAEEVRVRYVFRNRSNRPIRTIVAFPLPDRNLMEHGDGDRGWPRDFRTQVDGRPIRMQVEHRAFVGNVEHTALLRQLGVPIDGAEQYSQAITIIERLPAAQQRRLESLRLIEGFNDGGTRRFQPLWTIRETWYWTQTFPPGRNITVAHRYAPGAGGTVTSALVTEEFRQGEQMQEMRRRYCIDDAFLAGVDRMRARLRSGELVNVGEEWLGYILTTAGNWRSPIGDFRVVIDKGRPQNLVSFCGSGVRQISPTQFEIRRRNWRPDRDLDILILRPDRPNE